MKTRAKVESERFKYYVIAIATCIVVLVGLLWLQREPAIVEAYYSRTFYPFFAHLPKILFGWFPFSVGDLVYTLLAGALLWLASAAVVAGIKRQRLVALRRIMQVVLLLLGTYIYFYMSWGLHYYRVPLQQQLGLQLDTVEQADYIAILDRYIDQVNDLRSRLDTTKMDKSVAAQELELLMQAEHAQLPMLSHTQVKVKNPVSSTLASYFTVTGYFNPFTQEVQVNDRAPRTAYPFTVVHELAHQAGIGFEDECNFIAFLLLHDHPNVWYRYAAYYETVQYLLRPLYFQDKAHYASYIEKLSDAVRYDLEVERQFWQPYHGIFNRLTSLFYGSYLRYNNQPEGMARYSLMNRLVIAWEKQQAR